MRLESHAVRDEDHSDTALTIIHFRSDAQFSALALEMMVLETNARATHDSLQVIPLDSEIHRTIQETTRASQVKSVTRQ